MFLYVKDAKNIFHLACLVDLHLISAHPVGKTKMIYKFINWILQFVNW